MEAAADVALALGDGPGVDQLRRLHELAEERQDPWVSDEAVERRVEAGEAAEARLVVGACELGARRGLGGLRAAAVQA